MRDCCRKCGRFLKKNDLVLCGKCRKVFSGWSLKNRGKYTLEEIRTFRKKWINEKVELP